MTGFLALLTTGVLTYRSSTRYGDESNEACRATLIEGPAAARRLGRKAPTAAYQRHETWELDETVMLARWERCKAYKTSRGQAP